MGVRDGLSLKNLKWPSIPFERKIPKLIPVKETSTGRIRYNKELYKVYSETYRTISVALKVSRLMRAAILKYG
jgi:hypothetical protein